MSTSSVTTAVTTGVSVSQNFTVGDEFRVDVGSGRTGIGHTNTNYGVDLYNESFSIQGDTEQGLYFRYWGDLSGGAGPGPTNPLWMLGRLVASPPLYKAEFRLLYYDEEAGAERAVYSLESTGTFANVLDGTLRSCWESFLQNGDSSPAFRINAYPRMGIEFGAGGSSATDTGFRRREAGVMSLDNGGPADGGAALEMVELSADPAAGAANTGRLYLKDNGAGKTQLCIRFNTGAVQVIATQP